MTMVRPNRLTDLAAPARVKPRYVPLTAGLLARKGEAAPASSFFTSDPIAHPYEPAALRSPAPEAHELDPDWAAEMRWHARRHFEVPPEAPASHDLPARESEAHDERRRTGVPVPPKTARTALQVDFDLEVLARLAQAAQREGVSPSDLVAAALAVFLPRS